MLSKNIKKEETLARHICAKEPRRKYKVYYKYNDETNNHEVQLKTFLDNRENPMEISVDRNITLTEKQTHELGVNFQKTSHPKKLYHGYAEVSAEHCIKENCEVNTDTNDGKKPFHALIVYPKNFDEQSIAVTLAKKAKFIKYSE